MRTIALSLAFAITLVATAFDASAGEPTRRDKIGQMLMVGFLGDGTDHDWFRSVLGQVSDGKIGGVLYLKRNIAGRKSVQAMNEALVAAAGDRAQPLIGIDQEGGYIQRLTERVGFPSVPTARTIAARTDPRAAYETYSELGRHLRNWGFNLNLGPVVDLNVNPRNPIIGRLGRSFSADPDVVVQYAAAFINGHRKAGLLTAIKHFPGHGSSVGDSHKGLVDVTDTWTEAELEPFRRLIREGKADIVMTAHVRNAKLQADGDRDPASLSKAAIQGVLRGKLGFDRVVISDDMQMAGVADLHGLRQRVLRAVLAGTDVLIFANDKNPDLRIPEKVIDILDAEAAERPEVAARIDESYLRIIRLKRDLAIRVPASGGALQPARPLTTRSILPATPLSTPLSMPQAEPLALPVEPVTARGEPVDGDGPVTIVTPQVMAAMIRDTRLVVELDDTTTGAVAGAPGAKPGLFPGAWRVFHGVGVPLGNDRRGV
ncbi:MAG: glycoside hydrolase family 3 protein, partial [Pseudomonadota bacterium]|nr:glycoside hydrolase family 3 protein [Pseudomonadota bacterium]